MNPVGVLTATAFLCNAGALAGCTAGTLPAIVFVNYVEARRLHDSPSTGSGFSTAKVAALRTARALIYVKESDAQERVPPPATAFNAELALGAPRVRIERNLIK